jgi:hypothetical protein
MSNVERAQFIEVFADVVCPFTHVGLRRLVAYRRQKHREDIAIRVRAWPLEQLVLPPLSIVFGATAASSDSRAALAVRRIWDARSLLFARPVCAKRFVLIGIIDHRPVPSSWHGFSNRVPRRVIDLATIGRFRLRSTQLRPEYLESRTPY